MGGGVLVRLGAGGSSKRIYLMGYTAKKLLMESLSCSMCRAGVGPWVLEDASASGSEKCQ